MAAPRERDRLAVVHGAPTLATKPDDQDNSGYLTLAPMRCTPVRQTAWCAPKTPGQTYSDGVSRRWFAGGPGGVRAGLSVALLGGTLAACGAPTTTPARPTRVAAAVPGRVVANPPAVDSCGRPLHRLTLTPGWAITHRGAPHALEGWADRTSALPGEPVSLHVSSVAPTFTATAYRMGWYGAAGGAQVWQSAPTPGVAYPVPPMAGPTRTVATTWPASLALPTTSWPPGAYLVRLDSAAGQRFVPLTIRSPQTRGRIVMVNDVTTWEAYNEWGGYSLYHGTKGEADFAGRSRAVSFDRPYADDGSGGFVAQDLAPIAHAERLGLCLAYATDVDLHAVSDLLTGASAVVTLSHDEYWSSAMRTAVTQARDAGVNVAFLGSNAVFRHIRFGDSAFGPDRLEIGYKRLTDPLYPSDKAEVTVDWREPPVPRPESTLTGVFYECNPVDADMVITDASSWLFAHTPARAGLHLPHVVGPEYDRVNPGVPTPSTIEVLTHSPVRCRGVRSYSDSAYYTASSGAGVFASGTNWFTRALPEAGATGVTAQVVGGELTNLLRAYAEGPAGVAHPSVPNLAGLHEFRGDPIAAAQGTAR